MDNQKSLLISDIINKLQGSKFSPNWIFNGDTIMSESKEMSGKQHSKPTKDFLNPW